MMGGIGILDTLAAAIGRSALRKSLDGYCRLVTSEGENMLVADDGSLVTVFRLEGFRSMPGEKEISKAVTDLRLAFSSQLGTAGYTLQFW
jgi:intracellular multiplication protein IcmB